MYLQFGDIKEVLRNRQPDRRRTDNTMVKNYQRATGDTSNKINKQKNNLFILLGVLRFGDIDTVLRNRKSNRRRTDNSMANKGPKGQLDCSK